jgi:hypothetical protein
MFLIRGIAFSDEAVRDWEAKLAPALAEKLRRRRRGNQGAIPADARVQEWLVRCQVLSKLRRTAKHPPARSNRSQPVPANHRRLHILPFPRGD